MKVSKLKRVLVDYFASQERKDDRLILFADNVLNYLKKYSSKKYTLAYRSLPIERNYWDEEYYDWYFSDKSDSIANGFEIALISKAFLSKRDEESAQKKWENSVTQMNPLVNSPDGVTTDLSSDNFIIETFSFVLSEHNDIKVFHELRKYKIQLRAYLIYGDEIGYSWDYIASDTSEYSIIANLGKNSLKERFGNWATISPKNIYKKSGVGTLIKDVFAPALYPSLKWAFDIINDHPIECSFNQLLKFSSEKEYKQKTFRSFPKPLHLMPIPCMDALRRILRQIQRNYHPVVFQIIKDNFRDLKFHINDYEWDYSDLVSHDYYIKLWEDSLWALIYLPSKNARQKIEDNRSEYQNLISDICNLAENLKLRVKVNFNTLKHIKNYHDKLVKKYNEQQIKEIHSREDYHFNVNEVFESFKM